MTVPRTRGLFCNRTLNLRSIKAVGYDMDYTLVHYRMEAWERLAYTFIQERLAERGWPVADLRFDPSLVIQGLIIDSELGNVVKANRFGYVKRAYHGTRPLPFEDLKRTYARELVDLRDPRFVFLNTLFSISECCLWMQLVDRLDAGEIPEPVGYGDLHRIVRRTLDEAHAEGLMKERILRDPEAFVELDDEVALTLLDQRAAGKKILLITNSEYAYGAPVLSYALDRYLGAGQSWRDLFDATFFAARKPDFFRVSMPCFEVVDEGGLLREHRGPVRTGGIYVGGNAQLVEDSFGLVGEEILYVGDHVFVDVHLTKSELRWRTALVLRDLEQEIEALEAFAEDRRTLEAMMEEKTRLEAAYAAQRLMLQRLREGYGPQPDRPAEEIEAEIARLREGIAELDGRIAPLAKASSELVNPRWGPLMRAGNDKSLLARQVERYADVYTSRVSNFLLHTPFVYLRSPRGSLPHDP
ncbi:MAG: HAD family hydrolase [Deltaproteobacteria bacterium]|nr:MAG: HAD family hydrolase [Deltaproteobacteria bacterium]